MNENLDLTKILEGCPKGTEFYHAGYGRVWFIGISIDSNYSNYPDYPILLSLCNDPYCPNIPLTKKGTISAQYEGECLLFPSKDQRDWSKFVRFWDKPKKEKFDINTLQPFDKVLVRNTLTTLWKADFYSFSKYPDQDMAKCVGGYWFNCIPYNDDTKYLIGTNKDCPEYYKWWEE